MSLRVIAGVRRIEIDAGQRERGDQKEGYFTNPDGYLLQSRVGLHITALCRQLATLRTNRRPSSGLDLIVALGRAQGIPADEFGILAQSNQLNTFQAWYAARHNWGMA